jgi:hypothetical protein
MRREARARNGSLTIIVLTPLTTIWRRVRANPELVGMYLVSLEYFEP